jgi:hypothetical protein
MSEPRAQRTLVKSPPELWAEISDVSTLARHLGEFGEIRITETKPETTIAWEGDRARGTVELEPSGWGTRVTITAQVPEPEPEPEPEVTVWEAVAEEDQVEPEPEPEPVVRPERTESVPPPSMKPAAAVAATPEPAARRGLLARLFGRRAKAEPVVEPEAVVAEPVVVEPVVEPEPEPEPEPEAIVVEEPAAPVEAPPVETAGFDAEQVEAILVGVLDDLGSAHHRPFSRG